MAKHFFNVSRKLLNKLHTASLIIAVKAVKVTN